MDPGKLDNLELAASYGLRHLYGDFTVSLKYKLIYKSYDTGLNDGRDDLSHVLSLKIDYPLRIFQTIRIWRLHFQRFF